MKKIEEIKIEERPRLTLQELQFLKTLVTDKLIDFIIPSDMKTALTEIREKLVEVVKETPL